MPRAPHETEEAMTWTTIASVQPPAFDEKSAEHNERSIERGFRHLEAALGMGARLCCMPEFFNVFGVPTEMMREAAANHADVLARTRDVANAHGSLVLLSMLVEDRHRFFDRAYLIDESGAIAGTYDKVHPTVGEREHLGVVAGDLPTVVATSLGRIGLAICYDVYFPAFFGALTRQRPDVILLPSLQRSEHELASEALVKVRAMDSTAYLVRSSYGRELEQPWMPGKMFGQSCVVHPDGTILANAGHYEGAAVARVALPYTWRRQRCGGYPTMSVRSFLDEDARPEVYRANGEEHAE